MTTSTLGLGLLFAVSALLALALVQSLYKPRSSSTAPPDERSVVLPDTSPSAFTLQPLVTPAEAAFLRVLLAAVPHSQLVFAKVRLADLVSPVCRSRRDWQVAFNRCAMKHVDFVVCDRGSFRVRCVVELDDSSHGRADRKARDAFVDDCLKGAGVACVRIPVERSYRAEDIRRLVNALAK